MATRQYITEQKLTGAQIDHDAHEVEQIVRSPDTRRLFTDRMADTNNKNKRYDRQIRIWGPHGQQRLESCRVALLNCSPTGSETLKNLVLGGIVGFTIIDGAKVSPQDLGNNFMVEASSLGESRAKVVTDLLQELNDTVSGSYMEETPEGIITNNPGFFGQFTVVIATQMREQDVLKLDEICREQNVVLVVVRSYGLMGLLRPSVPEHCIVESKPDNSVDDLRIHTPWPELCTFAASFDLAKVDDITLHHLPYAVLLVKAADAWRAAHGGALPSNSKERSAFKDSIQAMRRGSLEGIPVEAENFDEAVKAAFHAWTPYAIPSEVEALLEDEAAGPALSPASPTFWILVAALRAFKEQEGGGKFLPLDGSIPDMHATTELYLQLQRVYREKADKDVAAVEAHVHAILSRLGKDTSSISSDTVRLYCKQARNLRLVRYRSLAEEYSGESCRGSSLAQALASEGTSGCAALYVLLRAVDRFYAAHGRYPGSSADGLEEDVPALKLVAQQLLAECGAGSASIQDDYVTEMCRFGAAELHVVAAFMGGMAAQEVIKLVTGQFTSLSGSLVYNGIGCTTAALEL